MLLWRGLYLKCKCGVHPVDVVGTDGVVVDEKVKWNWKCNVEQRRTAKDHAWKKINIEIHICKNDKIVLFCGL